MSLFEEVASRMPTENILTYSQARITQMKKKIYQIPKQPQETSLAIEKVPDVKPLPDKVIKGPFNHDVIYVSTPNRQEENEAVSAGKNALPLCTILDEVCKKYGITILGIKSRRKHKRLVQARHEFCWRAKNETLKSYPVIASFIGRRDHTTALYSVRRYEEYIQMKKDCPDGNFYHVFDLNRVICN